MENNAEFTEITKEVAAKLMPLRKPNSNKGTYGKVLNIAGSINYQGAAYLSSVAPLKAGAGLVTLAAVEQVINNLAGCCPWVTFLPLNSHQNRCIDSSAFEQIKPALDTYTSISIGPGLSTLPEVSEFVQQVIKYLQNTEKNIVIDADALNIISAAEISKLPPNAVITPHPMELSRLIKIPLEEIQQNRIKYARYTSEKFGCNVVLKGDKTVVCSKEKEIFINTSGNSALAKAGSGDVLTGIISGLMAQGLMAQGLTPKDAAVTGVYMHGLCGELASKQMTQYSVLATDLINYIPAAIKEILNL